MTTRTIIAGVIAAIVVFCWGAAAHMVLELGSVGIKYMPHEEPVLAAMKLAINEPGFYFFPGMEESDDMTAEQEEAAMKAWVAKVEAGPRGILIYHPTGTTPISPAQLVTQFVTDLVGALIAAILLSQAVGLRTYRSRVLFVAVLGLFAGFAVHVPYWNWYGFPTSYTLANLASVFVGWLLGGVFLAAIVKPPAAAEAAAVPQE